MFYVEALSRKRIEPMMHPGGQGRHGAHMSEFDRLELIDAMEREVQLAHLDTRGNVLASMMIEGFGYIRVPVADGEANQISRHRRPA